MNAPGKHLAAHHEENHLRVARIAIIGLVARTGDMPGGRARDEHVRGGGGLELDELALAMADKGACASPETGDSVKLNMRLLIFNGL